MHSTFRNKFMYRKNDILKNIFQGKVLLMLKYVVFQRGNLTD